MKKRSKPKKKAKAKAPKAPPQAFYDALREELNGIADAILAAQHDIIALTKRVRQLEGQSTTADDIPITSNERPA